ncbi:MAG: hypothetical protein INQ03_00410 [Candidatus Heimdallarchaeota archaeon]|nr:hypothetical protein [Candidatus Heimdallarchaeota archaeon]
MIDICLWKVTESECINLKGRDHPHTKYNIRYWSEGAIDCFKDKYDKGLRHEHVITKKEMRELIFKLKKKELTLENIEVITSMARSCTVTKEEHDILSKYDKSHQGWERYKEAEIQVFDRMKGEFVEFDELIKNR